MGTGAWGWEYGNSTVGTAAIFLLSVSKIILHRTIRMIYFDGSMGMGLEGQQFFLLSISKNILHLMIQMIYFDGSVGTGAWGREHESGTVGTSYDSNDYFDGSVGKGAWERHQGNCSNFLLSISKKNLHRMIQMIYFFTLE